MKALEFPIFLDFSGYCSDTVLAMSHVIDLVGFVASSQYQLDLKITTTTW